MKKIDKIFLSIIVPIYNEIERLKNLHGIAKFLRNQNFSSELIVVDDGSFDRTKNLLKEMSKKLGFKVISHSKNQGKGFAVKSGMLKAKGKYRLFTDIDLSVPIEECNKFIVNINKYPVVIASRRLKNSRIIIRQSWIRESMGRFFTLLSRRVLCVNISDFTCGFKCFNEEAANNIFSKSKINRWGFDSEILFIAKNSGYKILEIPVSWRHDSNTKVKFPQDIINSFNELIKIRFHNMRGFYK